MKLVIFLGAVTLALHTGIAADTGSKSYLLSTGKNDQERLDKQHLIYRDKALAQLEKAGIKEGMTVWDIGCGSGSMTLELAQKVGPSGRVIAIDISQDQLDIVAEKVVQAHLNNVITIKADILDKMTFESRQPLRADMIYHRFVLMHLINPLLAINNMKSYLNPKGVIVGQESIIDETRYEPEVPFLQHQNQRLLLGTQKMGIDTSIGRTLDILYQKAGFKTEFYRTDYRISKAELIPFFKMGMQSTRTNFIKAGLMTEEQVNAYERDVKDLAESDFYFEKISQQGHIIARMN